MKGNVMRDRGLPYSAPCSPVARLCLESMQLKSRERAEGHSVALPRSCVKDIALFVADIRPPPIVIETSSYPWRPTCVFSATALS